MGQAVGYSIRCAGWPSDALTVTETYENGDLLERHVKLEADRLQQYAESAGEKWLDLIRVLDLDELTDFDGDEALFTGETNYGLEDDERLPALRACGLSYFAQADGYDSYGGEFYAYRPEWVEEVSGPETDGEPLLDKTTWQQLHERAGDYAEAVELIENWFEIPRRVFAETDGARHPLGS